MKRERKKRERSVKEERKERGRRVESGNMAGPGNNPVQVLST